MHPQYTFVQPTTRFLFLSDHNRIFLFIKGLLYIVLFLALYFKDLDTIATREGFIFLFGGLPIRDTKIFAGLSELDADYLGVGLCWFESLEIFQSEMGYFILTIVD